MAKFVTKTAFTIGLLAVLMAVPAFGASINKSIKIDAGETSDGATSVNGSISVGADAVVTGGLTTVNGKIRVDDGATIKHAKTVNGGIRVAGDVKARDLTTVNGALEIGPNSSVDGAASAVNGRITLDNGAAVTGDVENVNGHIEMIAAEVGGDLITVNGDVSLEDGAVLKGNLIVEKPSSFNWGKQKQRKPRIVIGPGSRVKGTIELEREVDLFISEDAKVGGVSGVMSMDDAVRFSGDSP
jgi:cytoskeletal protein CcmA (bactofilin family)